MKIRLRPTTRGSANARIVNPKNTIAILAALRGSLASANGTCRASRRTSNIIAVEEAVGTTSTAMIATTTPVTSGDTNRARNPTTASKAARTR